VGTLMLIDTLMGGYGVFRECLGLRFRSGFVL